MGDENWDDDDSGSTPVTIAPISNGTSNGWESQATGRGFGRGFGGGVTGGSDADDAGAVGGGFGGGGFGRGKGGRGGGFGGGFGRGGDSAGGSSSGGGGGFGGGSRGGFGGSRGGGGGGGGRGGFGGGRGGGRGGFGGGSEGGSGGGGGFGGGFGRGKGGFGSKPSGGFDDDADDDDNGNSGTNGFGGGFGSRGGFKGGAKSFGGSSCRKCGEEGHFAKDCPTKGDSGGGSTCHKCGEEGHFARECPSGGSSGGGSGCRKCGEDGHFARDCPNGGDENGTGEQRPAPVVYIPPEPSDEEKDVFRTIAQGINFDKYDEIPVEVTGSGKIPEPIRSFEEAHLYDAFLQNIKLANYMKPTPVQKYAIPIAIANRDLMACAQTGSGKTAAFLLPVLSRMMQDGLSGSRFSEIQAPAALVISPTRELTVQIFMEARKFSHKTALRPVVCYGGVSVAHQLRQIENGCHILVATPGRLKDFAERKKISLQNVKYLILDEADRMLDMGFKPVISSIINDFGMPSKEDRLTLMFSATFPEEIQNLAAEFLNDYVFLTIGKVGGTSSDIEQVIEEVADSEKRDRLIDLLSTEGANRNLVFVETKRAADFLASILSQNGFPTTSIHGDRFQEQREEALRDFRSGRCSILIATAVAARGLDIEDVKQVVNYDLPQEVDEYVHRIGRTGRIGNQGKAVSFFSRGRDERLARALVKILADANQVVPDWLEDVAETALGTGYGPKGGRYGGKDTRKFNNDDTSYPTSFESNTVDNGGFVPAGGGDDEEW